MDAVVLCGGVGTRLRSVVKDVPKPLATVLGRPFLSHLLNYLASTGFVERVILATGYLAQSVEDQYGNEYAGMRIAYSRELQPLGTGGAVTHAIRNFKLSRPFFLLNGDSFVDANLSELLAMWHRHPESIILSLYPAIDCSRFGMVEVHGSIVKRFIEKSDRQECGLINAGIYVLSEQILNNWMVWPNSTVSLEREVLEKLVGDERVLGVQTGTCFIDIGLPDTYQAATKFFVDFEAGRKKS
jgi:D-glycero-alpha-D-manno-heptose 1-phosphate guanylyltransferase